jgi:HK97 family phage portal protein
MFQWARRLFQTRDYNASQIRSLVYGPPTTSGIEISEETALGLTAVYRSVDVISSTIATLIHDSGVARKTPGQGIDLLPHHDVSQVMKSPNDLQNYYKFWRAFIQSVVCSGNAYAEIERSSTGNPIGLHLLHWRNVQVKQHDDGSIYYCLQREGKELDARNVLHLITASWDGITGISPIRAAREALGLGRAAELYSASVYGRGGTPRGFLKTNADLTPESKASIREAWEIIHQGPESSGKVGILPPGSDFIVTNMTPEDSALLASRAFQIDEVSRIFGVPGSLLFAGAGTGSADEAAYQQFLAHGLGPILANLSAEMETKLLTFKERYSGLCVHFPVDSIIKRNFQSNADTLGRLVLCGVVKVNEAREKLGLNPDSEGDTRLVPANQIVVGEDQESLTQTPAPIGSPANPAALPAPEQETEPQEPVTDAPEAVADTAMNGAQIASLLTIATAAASGELPAATAKAIVQAAFPVLDASQVDAILDPLLDMPAPATPALPAPPGGRSRVVEAVERAFTDQIARGLRRQAKGGTKGIALYVREAMAPTHAAYCATRGVEQTIEAFADRWVEHLADKDPASVQPEELLALTEELK